jgi:serine phosphatase RsbU (regulator of sigma subunit)
VLKNTLIIFLILFGFSSLAQVEDQVNQLLNKANDVFLSHPDSSFLLKIEAEKLIEESESDELKAKVYNSLASTYLQKAQLKKTADYLDRAIKLCSKNNDETEAWNYKLRANLLQRLGDHDKSIAYQDKAMAIYLESGDTLSYAATAVNTFLDYKHQKDTANCRMVIEKLDSLKDYFKGDMAYFYYQNKGTYYQMISKNNWADIYFNKAYQISVNENMIDSRATILALMGENKLAEKKYAEAEKHLKEAIELSKKNELIHEEAEALEVLVKVYVEQDKMALAFEKQSEMYALKNEIYQLEKVNHIHGLEKQLEVNEIQMKVNQKDLEISKKNAKIKAQKLEDTRNKHKYQLAIIALLVALLLGAIIGISLLRVRKLNKEIAKQHTIVEEQNLQIQEALDDINDSLRYSERLQKSLLPKSNSFEEAFKEHFIFYKPKQQVSGDFYWFTTQSNTHLFAVGDCTGHGVPGAMVSVVCTNGLNRAVREEQLVEPGKILDRTREIVISEFEKNEGEVKDGMDIALCSLEGNKLKYAGANNPLWIVRKDSFEIEEIKADKQPIGKYAGSSAYTTHEININPGDSIYIFSDGFVDQFGGEYGKKYKTKNFKSLLLSIQESNMKEQLDIVEQTFDAWKKDFEQLDDVCVIGIKF